MLKSALNSKIPAASKPFRSEGGFALIITIALLTFLVLVLFAMTTLTRVEINMAGGEQEMNIARENAKLALNTAVAQLQRHAGPDERVTARADIDPRNDENPYWTGVWEEFAGAPSLITWLVSGNEDPNATTPPFSPVPNLNRTLNPYSQPSFSPFTMPASWPAGTNMEFVRLVGLGTTGEEASGADRKGEDPLHPNVGPVPGGVVVPKIPIFSQSFPGLQSQTTSDYVVGHYAYWVGDQGVKASVGLPEQHIDVDAYIDPAADEKIRRLRQLSGQRMWFDGDNSGVNPGILEDYPQFDLTFQELDDLKKVLDYSQVRLALADIDPEQLKDRHHDITHLNYGVLASTDGSGLKIDLSAGTTAHSDFLDARPATLTSFGTASYELVAPTSLSADQPALVIAPVISEFVVRYSVWQDLSGAPGDPGELRVTMEADIQLWNPYSVDLDLTGSSLFMQLDGLPAIGVEHNFGIGVQSLDLKESMVDFILLDVAQIGSSTIRAGEIFNIATNAKTMPGLASVGSVILFPTSDPDDASATPRIDELSSGATNIEVRLWLFPSSGPLSLAERASEIDAEIESLPEEAVGHYVLPSFRLFETTDYPANDDSFRFGYNFRLRDADDDPLWLSVYDPREIGLSNSGRDALETQPDPTLAFMATLDTGPTELLRANTASSRVKLFELPLQEQVNMGALQHLYYHGRPAYALGNDWGGAVVNSDFDRFFLSTIPQLGSWAGRPGGSGGGWNFPVPNTRIIPYRSVDNSGNELPDTGDLQDEESAEHLLVQGMFNINSTSLNAWRSVIGSLNIRSDGGDNFDPDPTGAPAGNWVYATGDEHLTSAVFRFSQTAHLQTTRYGTLADLQTDPDLVYLQGVRELTEDQVNALAYEIVTLIRDKPTPEPFLTLSEFVASGIIQQALDIVDIGPLSPGNPISLADAQINDLIALYAPAFVTQADILSLLAPFMLARSDTFLVRAYGDAYNPATEETGARAYCEAIVQRVPATFDPSDDAVVPGSSGTYPFGRRFEVIYFRWLTPNQL